MTMTKLTEMSKVSPAPVAYVANVGWMLSAGAPCERLSTADGGEHPPRLRPSPQPLRQESLCQALLTTKWRLSDAFQAKPGPPTARPSREDAWMPCTIEELVHWAGQLSGRPRWKPGIGPGARREERRRERELVGFLSTLAHGLTPQAAAGVKEDESWHWRAPQAR